MPRAAHVRNRSWLENALSEKVSHGFRRGFVACSGEAQNSIESFKSAARDFAGGFTRNPFTERPWNSTNSEVRTISLPVQFAVSSPWSTPILVAFVLFKT